MAWCHQATSHYLSQCWPNFILQYGVTRPQGVKYPKSLSYLQDAVSAAETETSHVTLIQLMDGQEQVVWYKSAKIYNTYDWGWINQETLVHFLATSISQNVHALSSSQTKKYSNIKFRHVLFCAVAGRVQNYTCQVTLDIPGSPIDF